MVVKIGGSILRNGRDYIEAAQNIRRLFLEKGIRPIVVVSAIKGITDYLLHIARGDRKAIDDVERAYMQVAMELGSAKLIRRVKEELDRLRKAVETIEVADPILTDYILSYGEKLSKIVLVQALELSGVKAFELNAKDIVFTNNVHGDAVIDYVATSIALEKVYLVIKDSSYVPVIEGFIGSTIDGSITTLGRGGSDYTATTIASLLKLDKVYLVSDVDGIMTADPDIVPTAKLINNMSYAEALEASTYGAKGINPKSFDPLEKIYSSKVLIGSWKLFGTTVSKEVPEELKGPKLIMLKNAIGYSYIAVIGEGVSKAKFLKEILEAVIRLGIDIKGLQSHVHRPSVILYVDRSEGYNILKILHKILFEERRT